MSSIGPMVCEKAMRRFKTNFDLPEIYWCKFPRFLLVIKAEQAGESLSRLLTMKIEILVNVAKKISFSKEP